MLRAAIASGLLALLAASAPALAAPDSPGAAARLEADRSRPPPAPAREDPPLNAYEIVVALLAAATGVGAFVWISRRPEHGCGSPHG